jgi:type IV pilus assembly protein PilW
MLIKHNIFRGVTLVELMIAVAISSILMLGVGSVYFNSKRTYLVQEEFAYMQESARIAMHYLVDDIRKAGYVGCAWNTNLDYENYLSNNATVAGADMGNFLVGLEGAEATTSGPGDSVNLGGTPASGYVSRAAPSYITRTPLDGSDIIIVRYADGAGIKLAINNNAGNVWIDDLGNPALINVSGKKCHTASGVCEGDILLVSDCQKSRLFQATTLQTTADKGINITHTASGTPGNGQVNWGGASGKYPIFEVDDSAIAHAASYAYYVANNNDGEPSLFRQQLRTGSTPQELIVGVENMQILYGVDTDKTALDDTDFDGVANQYVTADAVNTNNDNVVSARISLLLRTNREISTKTSVAATAKTFFLGGATAATATSVTSPADRRLRKVFTSTVKLRNKGLAK